MNPSSGQTGPEAAAEEIFPMPLLSFWGGRRLRKKVEAQRHQAQRTIEGYCVDRRQVAKALDAITAELVRAAMSGRGLSPDMVEAKASLEKALGRTDR